MALQGKDTSSLVKDQIALVRNKGENLTIASEFYNTFNSLLSNVNSDMTDVQKSRVSDLVVASLALVYDKTASLPEMQNFGFDENLRQIPNNEEFYQRYERLIEDTDRISENPTDAFGHFSNSSVQEHLARALELSYAVSERAQMCKYLEYF